MIDVFEYGNILKVHDDYVVVKALPEGRRDVFSFLSDWFGLTDFYGIELLQEAKDKGYQFIDRDDEVFVFMKERD